MRRRKGEISIDARLRRAGLLHVAKIKREDPFRTVDREEINAACRRIAAAGAWDSRAGWGPESGYLLFYFASWAKARAMQHWIDRSGIARRPVPKMGPTKEEKAAKERELMEWALGSGAAREIVQAYRGQWLREVDDVAPARQRREFSAHGEAPAHRSRAAFHTSASLGPAAPTPLPPNGVRFQLRTSLEAA